MSASVSSGASPPSGSSAFISHNHAPHHPPAQSVQRFRVRFTGSGSEYLRIWIVNLLLTVLTAGLYHPWARARQLRYFCSNTLVASHALGFHGEPRKMARGWWLGTALLLTCAALAWWSRPAGMVAGLLLLALWPAFHQAGLQSRLAHTSWRGLRFAFAGGPKEAYLPWAAPFLILACLLMLGRVLLPALLESAGPLGAVLSGSLTGLGLAALLPYVHWQVTRHRHLGLAYAQLPTEFRATYRDAARLFLNTTGVAVVSAALAMAFGGLVFMLGLWARPDTIHPTPHLESARQALPVWLGLLGLAQVVPLVYFRAHAQNLAWTHTGNRWIRFKSELGFMPLLKLSLKNWALMALTLGLYWPFARVAMTRLRLQAVCVHMRISPDLLVIQAQNAHQAGASAMATSVRLGLRGST